MGLITEDTDNMSEAEIDEQELDRDAMRIEERERRKREYGNVPGEY